MKIRVKLILSFLMVAMLIGFVSYTALKGLEDITYSFEAIAEDTMPVTISLGHLAKEVSRMELELYEYILTGNEDSFDEFLESRKIFEFYKADIVKREGYNVDGKWRSLMNNMEIMSEKYLYFSENFNDIKEEYIKSGGNVEDLGKFSELKEVEDELFLILDDRIGHENEELDEQREAVEVALSDTERNILIYVLVVLSLSIFLGLFVSKHISDPIEKLKIVSDEITRGRMFKGVEVKSNDEVGELSKAFNKMALELRESHRSLEKKVKIRTKELQKKLFELEKFQDLTSGRELRMVELKKEVNDLLERLGEKPKYGMKKKENNSGANE